MSIPVAKSSKVAKKRTYAIAALVVASITSLAVFSQPSQALGPDSVNVGSELDASHTNGDEASSANTSLQIQSSPDDVSGEVDASYQRDDDSGNAGVSFGAGK